MKYILQAVDLSQTIWQLTEFANNKNKKGRNKIITSNIEHPSVLNVCKHLEKMDLKLHMLQ